MIRSFLNRMMDPRIVDRLAAQKQSILKGLLCSAGAAALAGGMIGLIKLVVGAVKDGDSERLMLLSGAVIILFAVKYFFTRGQAYYLSRAANRLTSDLRIQLFEKLQRLPLSYFQEKRQGAIQSVLTNDVNLFQSAVTTLRDATDGPIKVVSGIAILFTLHWQLASVAFLMVPVLAIVIKRNSRKMRAAQDQVQADLSNLNAMMHETLAGTRIVQAFGAEERVSGRFRDLVNASFESQMVAVRRFAKLKPMVELIGAVGIAAVVMAVALLMKTNPIGVDALTAFLFNLDYINQGFRNLGALRQTTEQIRSAADRIDSEILHQPEPLADSPSATVLKEFSGRIEFRNVSYTYPDGTEALRDVSFTIDPGTSLALVGPSGSGKSTIADLLLRFADPTSGQILFDGQDIRKLKTAWVRDQIGVVPQTTLLFSGSIEENIRMGLPTASSEEVLAASSAANAGFVLHMPRQFETELGERGVRLSGGEAQRIAIARAFVRKPKILLLDEATSNLDAVSEKAVQEALDEIMQDRTSLTIAHRLSTAARASKILMLRKGAVVEWGTFQDLMANGGAFAHMYQAYADGMLDGATL